MSCDMELTQVVDELGLHDSMDVLRTEWESSQRSLPSGDLFFFAPEFAIEACREVHLSEEMAQAAAAACGRLPASLAVKALAWHYHHCLFETAGPPYDRGGVFGTAGSWPSLEGALHEDAGMFYLLVLLSGLPTMKAVHDAHSVPAEVRRDTLLDLTLWLDQMRQRRPSAAWGLTPYNIGWLAHHFRGDLYRLGRLQFQFASFWGRLRAFRHITTGAVLALSEEGVGYDERGQPAPAPAAWQASLTITDEGARGSPILPTGRAVNHEVFLPTAEWRQALAPRDPGVNIHIPAGEPMTPQRCGDSFRQAVGFFPRHFPDRPFIAFCCGSWILNGQLEEWLPPTSNLVRFQREVYLFPIRLSLETLLDRVFGGAPPDLAKAPRDTALRRAILDHLLAGKAFRPTGGGCFLFPEDLDWGREVYRRQRLGWVLDEGPGGRC